MSYCLVYTLEKKNMDSQKLLKTYGLVSLQHLLLLCLFQPNKVYLYNEFNQATKIGSNRDQFNAIQPPA